MSFADMTPDFQSAAGERDNAIPEFRMEPVKNNFRSEREGKPCFDEVEFVRIVVPGDRKTEWDGRVTDMHRARWPRHYAAFKAQQEAPTEGTPIKEWPPIGRAQAEELAFAHVKTVEQLAELPDELLNKTVSMGGFDLREKARRWLAAAKDAAPMEALAAENKELKANMDILQQDLADMRRALDGMRAQKEASNAGA